MREIAELSVKWSSMISNDTGLREIAQSNVKWCSVTTNGTAKREMGQRSAGGMTSGIVKLGAKIKVSKVSRLCLRFSELQAT